MIDGVPLVCFTGQVPTHLIGNDTFQEVDFVGITRSICKYAVMVRKREDLAETIKKAFYIAKTGKPGVVVVDLPKDVQRACGSDFYPQEIMVRGYKPKLSVHMGQLYCRPPGFTVMPPGKYSAGGLQSGCTVNLTGVQYK